MQINMFVNELIIRQMPANVLQSAVIHRQIMKVNSSLIAPSERMEEWKNGRLETRYVEL